MLADGFKLMVVGLCTVFIFLAFMILTITLLAKVLLPFIKKTKSQEVSAAGQTGAVLGPVQSEKAVVAAIAAAVSRYRADRKK
jgi:sodium pump decarboxylase gamma subunit